MFDFITGLFTVYLENLNYWSITLLMAVESSFIPFPSEIVIPPAAFLAAEGKLNLFGVIGAGTLGSLMGALINYFLAVWMGRPLIYAFAKTRIAHFLLVDEAGVKKSEDYFIAHGRSATFLGRLVPAIRQLISIPAGLAKMPLGSFVLYTTLGAFLWNTVLALLGYFLKDFWKTYYVYINWSLIILGVLFVVYLFWQGLRKHKKTDVPTREF